MMKGFHHEQASQQVREVLPPIRRVFLNGLAILMNLIPYQRRAINGGKCAIEVEGGRFRHEIGLLTSKSLPAAGFSDL